MPGRKYFGEWLRKNAERYLLEAAADEIAARYPNLCAKPYREKGFVPYLWRNIFVPIYSKIPWNIRRRIILSTS